MVKLICGFDEAGRGPLAGPVTAGAVILPDDFPVEILNDSKKLSEKKRDAAEKIILQNSRGIKITQMLFYRTQTTNYHLSLG